MRLPTELLAEICKTAVQQDIQDSNAVTFSKQTAATCHPIWISRTFERCSQMRLAAKVLDALVTPDMLRSLDVSVKQAYFCDSEQALVQLQAMAQQAPLNFKPFVKGLSIYVELSRPKEFTRRLLESVGQLLEGLELEEILFLFDPNLAEPSQLWLESDITALLLSGLKKQRRLRAFSLQNAKVSDRLLFPQPVRLAGGCELLQAVSNIESLGMAGVSPTADPFSANWKLQPSLKKLLPNLKRVDFNFPLGLGIAYSQGHVPPQPAGTPTSDSTWKLPWSLSCKESPSLTHMCLVDADVSLATLKRFLWASHETLQHLHIIALYFVEEAPEEVDLPPLPQLKHLWLRLLNEQPRQAQDLLRWLMRAPSIETACFNLAAGPHAAALPMLTDSLQGRWRNIKHLCWSPPRPSLSVQKELVDLAVKRHVELDASGRHNSTCLQRVNTVLNRQHT